LLTLLRRNDFISAPYAVSLAEYVKELDV